MNDANVDPVGRYFAGSISLDQTPGAGALYRLDTDGTLSVVVPGTTISNGIDWSPDGSLCYFIDSTLRSVDVFNYDVSDGGLSGRRTFVDTTNVPGVPDGLTVDAEGSVWVAFFGGSRVCRYRPDGAMDLTVHVSTELVTSCCFGGPGLDRLFISTSRENMSPAEMRRQPLAGSIFCVRTGRRGQRGRLLEHERRPQRSGPPGMAHQGHAPARRSLNG